MNPLLMRVNPLSQKSEPPCRISIKICVQIQKEEMAFAISSFWYTEGLE